MSKTEENKESPSGGAKPRYLMCKCGHDLGDHTDTPKANCLGQGACSPLGGLRCAEFREA